MQREWERERDSEKMKSAYALVHAMIIIFIWINLRLLCVAQTLKPQSVYFYCQLRCMRCVACLHDTIPSYRCTISSSTRRHSQRSQLLASSLKINYNCVYVSNRVHSDSLGNLRSVCVRRTVRQCLHTAPATTWPVVLLHHRSMCISFALMFDWCVHCAL